MSTVVRSKLLRCAVIVLYAIAMIAVGLIRHDSASLEAGLEASQAMAAYALPSGEPVLLCDHGNFGDHTSPGEGIPSGHNCCDACVIAHAPGLGGVAGPAFVFRPNVGLAYAATQPPALIALKRGAPVSRGPPQA